MSTTLASAVLVEGEQSKTKIEICDASLKVASACWDIATARAPLLSRNKRDYLKEQRREYLKASRNPQMRASAEAHCRDVLFQAGFSVLGGCEL